MCEYNKTYDSQSKTLIEFLMSTTEYLCASTQRKFSKDADWVLRHIYRALKQKKLQKLYDIGRFITYNINGLTVIYDGQSRLITALFILKASSLILPDDEIRDSLNKYIFIKEDALFKRKESNDTKVRIIPRFKDDREILNSILCMKKINEVNDEIKKSNLYKAYKSAENILSKMNENDIIEFIQYYLKSNLVIEQCLTPIDAAERMEVANMEGVPFTEVEAIRTHLIDCDMQQNDAVFERFENLVNDDNNGQPNLNILKSASLRYNNKMLFATTDHVMKTRYKISSSEDSMKFLNEIQHSREISNHIYKNRPYVKQFGTEFMYNILVPIFKNKDNVDLKIVDSISMIAFCRSEFSFNPLATHIWFDYLNKYKETRNLNDLPKISNYEDYITRTKSLLNIEIQSMLESYKKKKEKNSKTTLHISLPKLSKICVDLNTICNQSNETMINWDNLDFEHISSINSNDGVSIEKKCSIGNLVRFSAKKDNKLKGNRSLKNKPFEEKKEDYKISSISSCKDLAKYENFTTEIIDQRTDEILKNIWEMINSKCNR